MNNGNQYIGPISRFSFDLPLFHNFICSHAIIAPDGSGIAHGFNIGTGLIMDSGRCTHRNQMALTRMRPSGSMEPDIRSSVAEFSDFSSLLWNVAERSHTPSYSVQASQTLFRVMAVVHYKIKMVVRQHRRLLQMKPRFSES
jgi:hypothetical protein